MSNNDDTIRRQAAIEEIARWIGYIDEDMILRIQTGLKKLPPEKPEQWIPVSEKPPLRDGRYYVTRHDFVTKADFVDILWYEKCVWWNRQATGDYAVTAWMPLPEPWKGEER